LQQSRRGPPRSSLFPYTTLFRSKVLVVKRTQSEVPFHTGRDVWFHELYETAEPTNTAEIMDAEDPLFILYTSGSTGKHKGMVHTDRKSTRLNSSHVKISYAVFCL